MINYYRASVRQSQKEAAAKLRPISAPTLVIWGERDSYLGPDLAEPDHDDVPNLDRVERLPDASHWVHHDEAERVNQLLIEFFAPAPQPNAPKLDDVVTRPPRTHGGVASSDTVEASGCRHRVRLRFHPERSNMSRDTPTVVLVHGAFADGSSWNGVIERLQAEVYRSSAPANPLRGISARLRVHRERVRADAGPRRPCRPLLRRRRDPDAASESDERRRASCIVAAFAPDEGEQPGRRLSGLEGLHPGQRASRSSPPTRRTDGEPVVEFSIDPAKIHDAFAADLPAEPTR